MMLTAETYALVVSVLVPQCNILTIALFDDAAPAAINWSHVHRYLRPPLSGCNCLNFCQIRWQRGQVPSEYLMSNG